MNAEKTSLSTSRRNVLRATAFGVGAFTVAGGIRGIATPVVAQTVTETIYMSDTDSDSAEPTRLFTVDLDTSTNEAVLTQIALISDPDFTSVDAIAASPDGEVVYLVDKDSSHLGEFDTTTSTFTDRGTVANLPGTTVLAAFGLDGLLYVASNATDTLYSIDVDVNPLTATELVTITGADVNGADIVFDSNGTLYLHSNTDDTLYTLDYDPNSPDYGTASVVGTDAGTSFTGLAIRGAGTGDLVGSSRALDALIVVDKTTGTRGTEFSMVLDGNPFDHRNGDMSVGRLIDEECEDCVLEEAVKYEFEDGDFVLDGEGDDGIRYVPGSYVSKEGEDGEPMEVTFETDYCSLWVIVKAGRDLNVQELVTEDGEVIASAPGSSAISFVEFYCTEAEASEAAENFPSNGKGRGNDE